MKKKYKKMIRAALAGIMAVGLVTGMPAVETEAGTAGIQMAKETTVKASLEQRGEAADLTISNARQLKEFAQKVNNGNSYSGKVIKLTSDINFDGGTNNFEPIGNYSNNKEHYFKGTFDGCGHTISGIDVTDGYRAALFGHVDRGGEIKNVTLKDCSFSGGSVAGIVWELHYDASVSNCHVLSSTITSSGYAGGIACISRGTIVNCSSDSTVKNESTDRYGAVGGIVGKVEQWSGNINAWVINSCNTGEISGGNYVGGIVGDTNAYSGSGKVTIQNCFNTGKVTGEDSYVGGIAGRVVSNSIVASCYTAKEAADVNFGVMNGTEGTGKNNNTDYPLSYMKTRAFLDQMNANRGDNADWFPWELRADSPYPIQVKLSDLSKCSVSLAGGSYIYNGEEQKPAVSVVNGGSTLVQDVDYTVTYTDNVDAGNATAIVSGIGRFTGEITLPFIIGKAEQSISYTKSFSKTYTAKAFSLGSKLESGEGTLTYEISDPNVAVVSQTGTVTLKGIGKAVITTVSAATKNYNECRVTTTVTVKPKKENATVKASGSKMTIKWDKDAKAGGYYIQYANNKAFTKNRKQITVKKSSKTSKTVKKLKKGTYYVKVRAYKAATVNGGVSNITGAWSKTQKVKIK